MGNYTWIKTSVIKIWSQVSIKPTIKCCIKSYDFKLKKHSFKTVLIVKKCVVQYIYKSQNMAYFNIN